MRNTHNKIKNLKQYENADANNVCKFGLDLFYNFEKSCDEIISTITLKKN